MATSAPRRSILRYTDQGQGLPVILLHGFPLDGRIWEAQAAELSKTHRVIVPDLLGFGKTSGDQRFTLEAQADAVHALATELGALPCVLGGLSMGGYVAFAFARKYATDLKGLILVDTKAAGDDATAKEGRQKMIDLVRKDGPKAISDQMLPKMLTDATIKNNAMLAGRLRTIMESQSARTIENALTALRNRPDHEAFLPSITVPTQVIVGEADPITPPKIAEAMCKAIPRCSVAVIRGAAHLSSMEQPAEVTKVMRTFLAGVV